MLRGVQKAPARRKTQDRPVSFLHVLAQDLAARSRNTGIRTRISAEEAVSCGVHREYIFHKNGSLKVNAVAVFSSTKGSMNCTTTRHVSLDMDTIDGPRFGIWTEVDTDVLADLIRSSFELDPTAFDREDDRYDAYMSSIDDDLRANEGNDDSDWRIAA